MGCFVTSAAGGRERRQQGREHAQEDREDNNETTPTSSIFMFIPHSEHTTIAILLSTFMSCPSDLALHRLDRLNALLLQTLTFTLTFHILTTSVLKRKKKKT